MRFVPVTLAASAVLLLSACGSTGLGDRARPDEFAVSRGAPLVVPPDFALTPPRPGEAEIGDPRSQALQALFGGPQARSAVEQDVLRSAGQDLAALGARSTVGDARTRVVNRGALVQTMLQAPAGPGREATVSTPQ